MNTQSDFDTALKDPTLVYQQPNEVLVDQRLDNSQKIKILKRWEQDQRELDVAQEEGMTGGETSQLGVILQALESLGYEPEAVEAPTKHGNPID